jgi:hypothetical protein
MNHREPPHSPAAARRALLWVTLALLPASALLGARTLPPGALPQEKPARSAPYLIALGAPPLTFLPPAPAPVEIVPSTTATPPSPAPVAVETIPAANSVFVSSPTAPVEPETVVASNPARSETQNEPKRTPSILPDDARPVVRPEDFLQYFPPYSQIPGATRHSDGVNVLVPVPRSVPAPPALPASSATYTTTPK